MRAETDRGRVRRAGSSEEEYRGGSLPPNNLPLQTTSFIGRAHDIVTVKQLLLGIPKASVPTRLLTLVGTGGCGKTRLALRVARELAEEGYYPDGVWLVELAAQTEASLVPHVVAATLGVRDQAGRSVVDALIDTLTPKQVLLILDNCEHLGPACAELSDALVRACPRLHILVTSRQPLAVVGETTWVVGALPTLDPEQISLDPGSEHGYGMDDLSTETVSDSSLRHIIQTEAVQLFIERAILAQSNFNLTHQNALPVVKICHRLDGIPLAIELAAARVRVLSVWQIADRLDDTLRLLTMGSSRLTRHQTLRATMDWSYRLLSPQEQAALCRLSVFAKGFSLEAAEAVMSGSRTSTAGPLSPVSLLDALDLLSNLVDKSLVSVLEVDQATARYRLLEPVRQYASDRLLEAQESEVVQARHAGFMVELAERIEPELDGPDQRIWLARLQTEYDNARAALRWAAKQSDPELELRLVGALAVFWHVRGFYSEGRAAIDRAYRRTANASPGQRAKLLVGAGMLAAAQSEYSLAATHHQNALVLYREVDDKRGIATCLRHLGTQSGNRGDFEWAINLTQQSLSLFQELGDVAGQAAAYNNLGVWAREQGQYQDAAAAYTESLWLYRRLRHTSRMALVLSNLGEVTHDLGETATATGYLSESVALYQSLADTYGEALNLHLLGKVASDQREVAQAGKHYRASLALWQRLGNRRRVALCLEGLAGLAAMRNEADRAARLFGAAEVLREEIGSPLSPSDRPGYEAHVALARARVSAALFGAAWTRGRAMLLEQAIAYALDEPMPSIGDDPPAPVTAVTIAPLAPPLPVPLTVTPLDVSQPAEPDRREEKTPSLLRPPSPASQSTPATLLRIHALGSLLIDSEGSHAADPNLATAKPRELLLYIMCHPWVTKEEIGVEVWPHATPIQLRNRFHEAMHRIRRSLGDPDWIISKNERYSFNRDLPYWFDVEVFETQIKEFKGASVTSDTVTRVPSAEAIARLQAALALYRGDFLINMPNNEWILNRREDLRQLYIEGLDTLGRCFIVTQEYGHAAEIYRQIVARDKFLEDAHRQLMICYARQGERSKALWHYQRLLKLLQDEFKSTPDVETTALFKRLVRGEEV